MKESAVGEKTESMVKTDHMENMEQIPIGTDRRKNG